MNLLTVIIPPHIYHSSGHGHMTNEQGIKLLIALWLFVFLWFLVALIGDQFIKSKKQSARKNNEYYFVPDWLDLIIDGGHIMFYCVSLLYLMGGIITGIYSLL